LDPRAVTDLRAASVGGRHVRRPRASVSATPTQIVERVVRASPTAVIAETTTWAEYPQVWRRLLDEVWSVVRPDGSITAGRNVMLYHDDAPNVEVGVEVEAPFEPIGRVVSSC